MRMILNWKKWTLTTRSVVLAAAAFVGMSQAPHALADTMLLSDTTMVMGTSADTFSFNTQSAGMVTATLSNLPWPSSLQTLNFSATSANSVLSSWSALTSPTQTASASFMVGPGTYFAHIMAAAQGDLNLGLYALNITFTPSAVPLPASDWMLLAGVLVLFGLTRVIGMFNRSHAPRQDFRQDLSPAL
jgi:hypothetical protein